MNNEQILKKAIEVAIKNGWNPTPDGLTDDVTKKIGSIWRNYRYYSIIFSHDFAKAFWEEDYKSAWSFLSIMPDKRTRISMGRNLNLKPDWKRHLQIMVLEKEPLKYIEKYL